MWSRRTSYEQAYASLHEGSLLSISLLALTLTCFSALPLFNATESFTSLLKLYVACDYFPSVDHPALRDWLGPEHYRNTVPPPPRPASSPTRRAPGAALHTSGPWAKAGSQASHVLSSLVPVTLEG
ncbi:hypothetical protein BC834DRAFT_867822 [Gloeopeniophorella convolvens]|nr:hypothetical protein BC834DRAFT_867822 [Gloeopeniophorella convolvens]